MWLLLQPRVESTCMEMQVGSDHTPTPAHSDAALPPLAPPGGGERPPTGRIWDKLPAPSELGVRTRSPEEPN